MSDRPHAHQGAPHAQNGTSVLPAARASSASWLRAREEAAALIGRALDRVSRAWVAEQIGRADSIVEDWFRPNAAKVRTAPIALLVARRADGRGLVVSDDEYNRIDAEIRRERART